MVDIEVHIDLNGRTRQIGLVRSSRARGSYPEIVDVLAEHGARGKTDAHALYRCVVFNVLISNVDDHLRNHGFLWLGKTGWSLSPGRALRRGDGSRRRLRCESLRDGRSTSAAWDT